MNTLGLRPPGVGGGDIIIIQGFGLEASATMPQAAADTAEAASAAVANVEATATLEEILSASAGTITATAD